MRGAVSGVIGVLGMNDAGDGPQRQDGNSGDESGGEEGKRAVEGVRVGVGEEAADGGLRIGFFYREQAVVGDA